MPPSHSTNARKPLLGNNTVPIPEINGTLTVSITLAADDNSSFLNSFLASSNFCRLLKTFANSLDPDQDREDVGPDLGSNC